MKLWVCALCLLALLTGTAPPASAGDLRAPIDLESTSVLPKGVGNPRFKNIFTSMEDKFGATGTPEPLALRLNKPIGWNEVLSQQTPFDRDKLKLMIQAAGVDPNGAAGFTAGQVFSYADVKVPVLGMGVTDQLTMAVAVPIMHVQISADTGISWTGDGQKVVNAMVGSNEYAGNAAIQKFNSMVNDGVNAKLKSYGYEPIQDQDVTGVSDIQLISKYQLYVDTLDSTCAKFSVTFPTGRTANPDRVVDAAMGDGQLKFSPGFVWEHKLLPELAWDNSAGYTLALPSTAEKRIPTDANSSLSADKEVVNRSAQHTFSLGTSLNYVFPSLGLSIGSGYSYQYQSALNYSGKRFAAERYEWLSNQSPSETLHSATATAGFSTVNWYKKKQFVYPFEAKFVYSHPLTGTNTATSDVYAGELVMFF